MPHFEGRLIQQAQYTDGAQASSNEGREQMMQSDETIMVTGGAGFIGSHIVERLAVTGSRVVVLDDLSTGSMANISGSLAAGRVVVHETDVRSRDMHEIFAEEHPDVVLHLAAQLDVRVSVQDPMLDADINILGTLNLLECARETGVRKVVVASSGGCVYGEARTLPIRESFRGRPRSPYGISKRVLHQYLEFYREVHGLRYAVLALSNVYGPRQNPHGEAGVVAIFLRAMLENHETTIFGDGSQTRDFVYVDDVAEAFIRSIGRAEGVMNIGTGTQTSVIELWRRCAEVVGYSRDPVFAPERSGELQANALDWSRAAQVLGWRPSWSATEGIRATASFFRDSREEAAVSVG
ncbi:MAG TPA: NAD-dependent epimerase/dehydratase family protein [Opitutaceae bacterium]